MIMIIINKNQVDHNQWSEFYGHIQGQIQDLKLGMAQMDYGLKWKFWEAQMDWKFGGKKRGGGGGGGGGGGAL